MRSSRPASGWLLLLLLSGVSGCWGGTASTPPTEAPVGPVWFEDITDAVELNFVHDPGPTGNYFMPQCVGSGLALFDADGDGRLDLYLLQNAGPKSRSVNRFYLQQPNGRFQDATANSGLGIAGHGMGAVVGDVNNDGRSDLLVTEYGSIRLFLNQSGGRFRDVTDEAGLRNPLWSASGAFLDYDRDGLLDLFVTNYVDYDPSWPCASPGGIRDFCAPKVFAGTSSKLFRNLGRQGMAPVVFEDVTLSSGVGGVAGPGLGVVCADFNGDGWQDVFVANDGKPNHLWINQQNGKFSEEAVSRGLAYTQMGQAFAGMGVAQGDLDNDGLLDLYVTHLTSETNTLWKQGPRGLFKDATAGTDLLRTHWRGTGFGTLMADFDHDGRLDLALVNGRVQRGGPAAGSALPAFWETYAERNQLLAGSAGGFRDISPANLPFCGPWNVGRGLACGDVDNDGAPDLVVTSIAGRARVFRNVAPERGHWVIVRAVEPKFQRDALGAEVSVEAGGVRRLRLVSSTESFLSAGPALLHFGLGTADRIDSIRVTWSDGVQEVFPGGPVDRRVELRRGEGRPATR